MKKRLTIILIVCAIVCLSTSFARKINGATPHRRDRNCGCENLSPTPNNAECRMQNVEYTMYNSQFTDR